MLAIIGGSGLTQLATLRITHRQVVRTPYGEASGPVTFGTIGAVEIIFLARHGYGHTIAPHEVNYRANLWALKEHGAHDIVAVNTVGAIDARLAPADLALPEQIIDYSYGRKHTYFEGAEAPVTHIDFTRPFCEDLRARLSRAAQRAGVDLLQAGVYAAVQGPRLETAAEIDRLERDGASLVGMTGMPEAALARELKLCYAMLAVVANPAAGRGSSSASIALNDIARVLETGMVKVRAILEQLMTQDGN